MLNGNYILYEDRSGPESEIVEDHAQRKTVERNIKRKPVKNINELQQNLRNGQLDNETDSVKYEKKIKEPKLLRYIPNTDVEEGYVTEKFETYDLKPAQDVERPRKYAFVKKPKNHSDGSINYAQSRSSSSCSSPNTNLPTISEHSEHYGADGGTYRIRPIPAPELPDINKLMRSEYEHKFDKYFSPRPKDMKFAAEVRYNIEDKIASSPLRWGILGSHPDSLYRVPSNEGAGAGRMVRLMRLLRWPAALIVVCVALAVFVYFLMPSNIDTDRAVNSTDWELSAASLGGQLRQVHDKARPRSPEKKQEPLLKPGTKTPEIDFYNAENGKNDVASIIDAITGNSPNRKLPIPPVFPSRITPEVQYGNEKGDADKLRGSQIIDETNTISSDSTVKPHITQKPEKPLAIYFKDTTSTTESITNSESVNDFSTFEEKQTTKRAEDLYAKRFRVGYKTLPAREQVGSKPNSGSELSVPIQIQDFYSRYPANNDVKFTSGHSKLFGISIEDAEKMRFTTQSSAYHTRVSPTLPTWRDEDTTTKKYPVINADVPQCHSPRLSLCRGVLPYDLAGAPVKMPGGDIAALLPQIEFLVASNCSDRVRQFVCALLEPECSPPPYPAKLPCYNLCQAIVDTCDGYVPRELIPTFNCRQYSRTDCVSARAPCGLRERRCGDSTCILRDWVCDGTKDCPDGEDEAGCAKCERDEFSCDSGTCIPKQWLCDGYLDCSKGEDEAENTCADREEPRVSEVEEESAGSAPAPSVRKPNRFSESHSRGNTHRSDDSSKELLETSDSSNALRRNFTRRPLPSRLSPYRTKLRQPPSTTSQPEEEPIEEKEPEKPKKQPVVRNKPKAKRTTTTSTTTTTPKPSVKNQEMVNNHESSEDINIADLGFFEDLGIEDKDDTKKLEANEAGEAPQSQNVRRMVDTVNAPNMPQPPNMPPVTESKQRHFNKIPNKLDTVIDGAAMLRKAAQQAAEQTKPDPNANANYEKFEDEMPGKGTSHSSPCPSGELRCVDGRCITLAQLCDGTIDCTDHADEDNCYT